MGYLNEDGLATLVGKVKGQVVQLTQAEYMQIPDSEKNFNNKIYFVEDEEFSWKIDDEPTLNSDGLAKSGGIYTYTSKIGSGTLSTTAQTIIPAINELDAKIGSGTLSTTAQTLIPAVNEVVTGLSNVLKSTTLGSGSDLNDVKTPGFYYITTGVANCPEDWTWCMVIGGMGVRQVLFRTNVISCRAYTGSPLTWTVWKNASLT